MDSLSIRLRWWNASSANQKVQEMIFISHCQLGIPHRWAPPWRVLLNYYWGEKKRKERGSSTLWCILGLGLVHDDSRTTLNLIVLSKHCLSIINSKTLHRQHRPTFNHSSHALYLPRMWHFIRSDFKIWWWWTAVTRHGTSAKDFCGSRGLTRSVNFLNWISPNGKSSLQDLVLTNFPANVSCSLSTPIASSDDLFLRVNISLAILRELPQH